MTRPGIAALDPTNGMPFSWNPGRRTAARRVSPSYATTTGCGWAATPTTRPARRAGRSRSSRSPAARSPPPTDPYTLPADLYNVPTSGAVNRLDRRTFDGSTLGTTSTLNTPSTDWSTTRGIFALQGMLYSGSTDGKFYAEPSTARASVRAAINLNGLTDFPVQSLSGTVLPRR